ncbi:hypothetical protein V6N13_097704 [Hibiscus sabdariffa]|uniref:Uncharacterized protein n=2 Tax=Hibiscus sabdariffa TaxID=183260 RepID=A0ABR2CAG4_9ROSI
MTSDNLGKFDNPSLPQEVASSGRLSHDSTRSGQQVSYGVDGRERISANEHMDLEMTSSVDTAIGTDSRQLQP